MIDLHIASAALTDHLRKHEFNQVFELLDEIAELCCNIEMSDSKEAAQEAVASLPQQFHHAVAAAYVLQQVFGAIASLDELDTVPADIE